jgi:TRAP-type C4-dicarboxylate transport system permease small subunit
MLVKLKHLFDKAIDYITIVLLVVLTYVCFHQVVARYVFSSPPSWTEEVSRYLFIWVTFLGAAIAFRTSAHLGLDFFVERFPVKLRRTSIIVINLILIAALCIICFKGIETVMAVEKQLSPALRIPMTYPYLAIPVGSFLMLMEIVWNLFTHPNE